MSQENVDVVGRTYEAFDRREMYLDVWHPEAEFRPAMAGAVEGKVYRGHSEMRHYLNELFESFSEVLVEDREFRDLGDRVLVLYRLRVQGRDSDLEIDQPGAALYELRDGKILGRRVTCRRQMLLRPPGFRSRRYSFARETRQRTRTKRPGAAASALGTSSVPASRPGARRLTVRGSGHTAPKGGLEECG